MNNKNQYAAAVLAFSIWGFLPWLLKTLTGHQAEEILYFRIFFSSLVLVLIVGVIRNSKLRADISTFRSYPSSEKMKVVALWLSGGLLLTINWLVFIYCVNNVNIRTASFSYLICPVLTAVLGYVVLKEKMSPMQWTAVLLCAISCALMGLNSVSELGYSFVIGSTYALYLILQRLYKEFDRITVLSVQILFSFLLLNIFFGSLVNSLPSETNFYIITAIIGAAFTVLPLFLNLYALTGVSSATVGILMYINPIVNFTIAILVFDEKVSSLQIIGYSIIAVALVLFNSQNFRKLQALTASRL
jgi:chloramphenicol-sensitive protein RarD